MLCYRNKYLRIYKRIIGFSYIKKNNGNYVHELEFFSILHI